MYLARFDVMALLDSGADLVKSKEEKVTVDAKLDCVMFVFCVGSWSLATPGSKIQYENKVAD